MGQGDGFWVTVLVERGVRIMLFVGLRVFCFRRMSTSFWVFFAWPCYCAAA